MTNEALSTRRKFGDRLPDTPPLILLPGLGGDERLFSPQRAAFPELIVPKWIKPRRGERLAEYASRFAEVINPGRDCFIGGVSFGGVVALELAALFDVRECFLIGSIRSPREIPKRLRFFKPVADLVTIPKNLSSLALTLGGRHLNPTVRGLLHQLKDTDAEFLRWAANAILQWTPSPRVQHVRVSQIHGDQDRIFPVSYVSADKVISGGGHLVSLRNSEEVNRFLRCRMIALS